MRALTFNEMDHVSGGYSLTEDPLHTSNHGLPGQSNFSTNAPASPSSSGGGNGNSGNGSSSNGSGNNGISPDKAQGVIGWLMGLAGFTDPATGLESGDTADAANTVQKYNQSTSEKYCENPALGNGTWDPSANNGGGGCVQH